MFIFVGACAIMNLKILQFLFENFKENRLQHRYIYNDHIIPILEQLNEGFKVSEIGRSVNNAPIFSVKFGRGSRTILLWSQMHGNESTTTKALFDLFKSISFSKSQFELLLSECTIVVIPILNPDGAKAYTRLNANAVDLNRDAQNLTQPESKVLRQLFDEIKPDFCFNLHGQRTIFSAGNANKPATVSFLSPSEDEKRTITDNRKIGMALISELNNNLQTQIPNQVGRYDDAFNHNCVGDTFQNFGVPTILFEAGHYENDYGREKTRYFIFQSLVLALNTIARNTLNRKSCDTYFEIPENKKLYFDVVIRNVKINNEISDIAIQYQERLINNKLCFVPIVEHVKLLRGYFGHREINAEEASVYTHDNKLIYEGYENDFVMLNNKKINTFFLKKVSFNVLFLLKLNYFCI